MARKGENIYKRKDGRYEGRYIKGRKPNGKLYYGSIYGHKYAEVKAKLMPLKARYAGSKLTSNNTGGIFSDWLVFWLEDIAKPNVKLSTYANYFGTVHRYILPLLGEKRLDKLNRDDIQQFINTLMSKNLGSGYIHGVFRVLNSTLEKATQMRIIYINPCNDITLPKISRTKVNVLTVNEQKILENVALRDKNGAAVILSLYTGMRLGEICALTWEDIDFLENTISVRHTLQRIPCQYNSKSKTRILFGTPKSTDSERVIPMSPHLAAYLYSLKKSSKSIYVISCKNGFAEPRIQGYRFQKLLKSAGLKPIHFHVLRHTFATRCMELGVDVTTLSRLLGHSSVKMTLDIYTDSVMEQRIAAMNTLDKLFSTASFY